MNKKIIIAISAILVLAAAAIMLYPHKIVDTPSSGVNAKLSMSNAPKLNEETRLVLKAVADRNASNVTLKIKLPEGFEFVSGELEKNIALEANKPVQIEARIKAVKTGEWTIAGNAGANDYLYVAVGEKSSSVSRQPFPISERGKKTAESD